MPNQISARTLARTATCTAILTLAALDVRAADQFLRYPDFSGQWGRDGRGPGRLHHAVVGTGDLSAPHRRLARSGLRRTSSVFGHGGRHAHGDHAGFLSTRERPWLIAGGPFWVQTETRHRVCCDG